MHELARLVIKKKIMSELRKRVTGDEKSAAADEATEEQTKSSPKKYKAVQARRAPRATFQVLGLFLLAVIIAATTLVIAFRVRSNEDKLDLALAELGAAREQNAQLLEVFRQILYNQVAARQADDAGAADPSAPYAASE